MHQHYSVMTQSIAGWTHVCEVWKLQRETEERHHKLYKRASEVRLSVLEPDWLSLLGATACTYLYSAFVFVTECTFALCTCAFTRVCFSEYMCVLVCVHVVLFEPQRVFEHAFIFWKTWMFVQISCQSIQFFFKIFRSGPKWNPEHVGPSIIVCHCVLLLFYCNIFCC